MCLQAPSEDTVQGLETTGDSSAGDSRGKGLCQHGATTSFASSWLEEGPELGSRGAN